MSSVLARGAASIGGVLEKKMKDVFERTDGTKEHTPQ